MLLRVLACRTGALFGSRSGNLSLAEVPALHRACASSSKKVPSLNEVQGLFAESMLLLSDAEESKDTTYFSDDFEDAKVGVREALSSYDTLLKSLPDSERRSVQEANDPKFKQLKEQYTILEDSLINDD